MRFTETHYILFFLLMPFLMQAQTGGKAKSKPTTFLSSKDSLTLVVEEGKKYVFHLVKPKKTLF